MPYKIHPLDQPGDTLFQHIRPTELPITVEEAKKLAEEAIKDWAKDSLLKTDKGREKMAASMAASIPDGTTYYNPELRLNVVNQDGVVVPMSSPEDTYDEEAWAKNGFIGGAVVIYPPDEQPAVPLAPDATVTEFEDAVIDTAVRGADNGSAS